MNYNIGDKVKIKSLEWYYENRDLIGNIDCDGYAFTDEMAEYCGKILTIVEVNSDSYCMCKDPYRHYWTDKMIECLVEPAPNNKIISQANEAINTAFENGAKFERERLAKAVENWCRANTNWFDEYDAEGRNFDYGKADELINLILGKE